jgi:CTP:molybdopterin cytidylyltransferase MocA
MPRLPIWTKVLLVIGSHAEEIASKITISSKIGIVVNHDFKEGMSSSVKCGVKNATSRG